MKKLVFVLLIVFLCVTGNAQTNCGPDTVGYTRMKSTGFFQNISLSTKTGVTEVAQWFAAPQTLTINGFEFFAWQSDGTDDSVTFTCSIYEAGTDSLPTGAPLATITVKADSTYGGGTLKELRKSVVFKTPVTITSNYVLTIENNSSVSASVYTNNYLLKDGKTKWYSSVKDSGKYYRSHSYKHLSVIFDADIIVQPYVLYQLQSGFTINECNNLGNTVTFSNAASPVTYSPFYNVNVFLNTMQNSFIWDYGDTTPRVKALNGSHKYTKRLNYNVTLRDSIAGWSVGCWDDSTATVYATPLPPALTNNGPLCEGDTLKLTATSVPGATIEWNGPGGYTSTLKNPVIAGVGVGNGGNYSAKATSMGCTSTNANTLALINSTPIKPVLSATKAAKYCVGETMSISASSTTGATFIWKGPGGFTSTSATPTLPSLTLLHTGDYTAIAKIGNCTSMPDSIYILVSNIPVTSPITGSDTSTQNLTKTYSVTGVPGSVYFWNITGGTQMTGDSTGNIQVKWNTAGTGTVKVREKTISGCAGAEKQMTVTVTAGPDPNGVREVYNESIKVYPNPAHGTLYIEYGIVADKITVTDIIGRVCNAQAEVLDGKGYSLDVKNLSQGIYLLKIESEGNEKVIRFRVD